MAFQPTSPPAGRLVRLGVVLDTRNASERVALLARMCERAGIDALWVHDFLGSPIDGLPRLDARTALAVAGRATTRPRLGIVLDPVERPQDTVRGLLDTLDPAVDLARLEISLAGARRAPDRVAPADYAQALDTSIRALQDIFAETPRDRSAPERMAGEGTRCRPRLSIEASSPPVSELAARWADDIFLPAAATTDIRSAVAAARQACEALGRDPPSQGVALEVPVSVGRTLAEAQARADAEPLFRQMGDAAEIGIFGTLEQCQDRVIALAHTGVTDLRCVLPNTPDVHDAIAQLTAMVVGTVNVLTPGAPRSKAPDPPVGWGGRPRLRRA